MGGGDSVSSSWLGDVDSGVPVRLRGDLTSEWTALWVGDCCRRGCKVLWILLLGWGAWRTWIPGVAVLPALEVLINVDGVGLSCG